MLAQQAALEKEAQERADRDKPADKPKGKLTGEQIDLLNPQGGIFDAPPALSMGSRVEDTTTGRLGTISALWDNSAEVTFDDGSKSDVAMDALVASSAPAVEKKAADVKPEAPAEKPVAKGPTQAEIVDYRKRLSILKSLRECLNG